MLLRERSNPTPVPSNERLEPRRREKRSGRQGRSSVSLGWNGARRQAAVRVRKPLTTTRRHRGTPLGMVRHSPQRRSGAGRSTRAERRPHAPLRLVVQGRGVGQTMWGSGESPVPTVSTDCWLVVGSLWIRAATRRAFSLELFEGGRNVGGYRCQGHGGARVDGRLERRFPERLCDVLDRLVLLVNVWEVVVAHVLVGVGRA